MEKDYYVRVPVSVRQLHSFGCEPVEKVLQEMECRQLILSAGAYLPEGNERQQLMADLKKYTDWFRSRGYEVFLWIWAFQCNFQNSFTHITDIDGHENANEFCPADPEFLAFAEKYVQELARCGADGLLFDDDFRFGFLGIGPACACVHHRKLAADYLGKPIEEVPMDSSVFCGEKNARREAFLWANGHSLEEFARRMRAAADSVAPKMRIGLCACLSSWDHDGSDAYRLARLFAGNTRPLLRLIGAPYWAESRSWGNRLQDVIELTRMEKSWEETSNVEVIAEGDVFPRPRSCVPASLLEGYDTALRADGTVDGILKYVLDYVSSVSYDNGYVERHLRNKPFYAWIARHFAEKEAVGVRVYEKKAKIKDAVFPKEFIGYENYDHLFFSPASRMLAFSGIPTCYSGEGCCGIAFGENVRCVPKEAFTRGLILDADAARILWEQGIDVGLSSLGDRFLPSDEIFPNGEIVELRRGIPAAYRANLKPGAKVMSRFMLGQEEAPASYYYENAGGEKYFVLLMSAYPVSDSSAFRSYPRAWQLTEITARFGSPLPAAVLGNPDVYVLCKKQENRMTIGVWNFSIDDVLHPAVTLNKKIKQVISLSGCTAEADGSTLFLSRLEPYGFAFAELETEE